MYAFVEYKAGLLSTTLHQQIACNRVVVKLLNTKLVSELSVLCATVRAIAMFIIICHRSLS
jgi:hypothetical protein